MVLLAGGRGKRGLQRVFRQTVYVGCFCPILVEGNCWRNCARWRGLPSPVGFIDVVLKQGREGGREEERKGWRFSIVRMGEDWWNKMGGFGVGAPGGFFFSFYVWLVGRTF